VPPGRRAWPPWRLRRSGPPVKGRRARAFPAGRPRFLRRGGPPAAVWKVSLRGDRRRTGREPSPPRRPRQEGGARRLPERAAGFPVPPKLPRAPGGFRAPPVVCVRRPRRVVCAFLSKEKIPGPKRGPGTRRGESPALHPSREGPFRRRRSAGLLASGVRVRRPSRLSAVAFAAIPVTAAGPRRTLTGFPVRPSRAPTGHSQSAKNVTAIKNATRTAPAVQVKTSGPRARLRRAPAPE